MKLRLRLSLLFRMVVAAGILPSISVVVALFLTVVGGALLLGLFGWTEEVLVALAALPRISAVTAVPPIAVATVAGLAVGVVVAGWPYLRARTSVRYLLPPDAPSPPAWSGRCWSVSTSSSSRRALRSSQPCRRSPV